jgi:hypothetical protein
VEKCDGLGGGEKMSPVPTMISQDAPVLEASDDMLDAGAPLAVPPPRGIADDPAMSKHGRHELFDAAIAAVGEDATMQVAQSLDLGAR